MCELLAGGSGRGRSCARSSQIGKLCLCLHLLVLDVLDNGTCFQKTISCKLFPSGINCVFFYLPWRILWPKDAFEVAPVVAEVSRRAWSVVARGVVGQSAVTGLLAAGASKKKGFFVREKIYLTISHSRTHSLHWSRL